MISAVGIVFNDKNEILLGLSNADDDRKGKWCFPGGGVDEGETPAEAAQREVFEESGILTKPLSEAYFEHPHKPGVYFFVLKQLGQQEIVMNEEFDMMGWHKELPDDTVPVNKEIMGLLYSRVGRMNKAKKKK